MQIFNDKLHQFTIYIPPMDFTIHQYLLTSAPAILFATGTRQQAERILPQIRELLGERKLKYIFISHMESDECGGLSVFFREYPDVKVLCSGYGARELSGWGYPGEVIAVDSQKGLEDRELSLQFFDYPSEAHLQNGVVCLEKNSGIFYSADLMLRYGDGTGKSLPGNWEAEVGSIGLANLPDNRSFDHLKEQLFGIRPAFVAVGHGFCLVTKTASGNP